MWLHIYAYVYVYAYMCGYIHRYIYMYICAHTHTHIYIYIYIYILMYICVYIYLCVFIYMYTYVCGHIREYIYIYICVSVGALACVCVSKTKYFLNPITRYYDMERYFRRINIICKLQNNNQPTTHINNSNKKMDVILISIHIMFARKHLDSSGHSTSK